MKEKKAFYPDKIGSYFRMEWLSLTFVTLFGIFYNVGLLASPWFEGHLAQCLADILGGNKKAGTMAMLVLAYIVVALAVQAARFVKRFYIRRFANNINRKMKGILYANLVRKSRAFLEKEGAGELMTKAISENSPQKSLTPVSQWSDTLSCCLFTTGGLRCSALCSLRYRISAQQR